MKRRKKFIANIAIIAIVIVTIITQLCYWAVALCAKDRMFNSVDDIPYNEVGMVLGTGPTTITGEKNLFFLYRIDAVEELYKAGKIRFILISGDNSRDDYSEPDVMRDSLIARGIPQEAIYLDYAGFRTWDSVVRAKKVFGQSKMTVISQQFHNERSLFIGDYFDMELIGYNAKDTPSRWHVFRAYFRESFARVKLFMDIIVGRQPHFMGEPIEIGDGKPQKGTNVFKNVKDTLPNATNSWGNAENVTWIMEQLRKDTFPVFDFSTYHLSKKEEMAANENLRLAWYGDDTFFKMDYIRQHYDTWKYVWRIFHIPNGGELGNVEKDVIFKLYLKEHHPELLIVGKDKAKHYANIQKHVMDSLTLNHEFLGEDLYTYSINIVWFNYLRWYHVRLFKGDLRKIGISIGKELSYADRIRAAVERYKDNTPHYGSGNSDRYAEFYMLYATALDSLISDMCNMCAGKPRQVEVKCHAKDDESRLWRKFYENEEYDEGHWEFDCGTVAEMESTRKRANMKARQYKPAIKRSYRQWLDYRQRTSRKLPPQCRKAYDNATLAFQDFVMTQCKNKFKYQID